MLSVASGPTLFHPPVISSPVSHCPELLEEPIENGVELLPSLDDDAPEEKEDDDAEEPFSLLRSSCSTLSSSISPLESSLAGRTEDSNSILQRGPSPIRAASLLASFQEEETLVHPCSPSCFGTPGNETTTAIATTTLEEDDDEERFPQNDKPSSFFTTSHDFTVSATMTEDVTPAQQQQHHWWRHLFQQLEQKHSQERTQWQSQLQKSTQQKTQLKSELKQTLQQQLLWLEERCLAPQHVLPGVAVPEKITPDTTMESASSSSRGPSFEVTARGTLLQGSDAELGPALGDGGLEMTYDTSVQVQKIQQLEQCLREQQWHHEQDRGEWMRLLEAAAADTALAAQQLIALQAKSTKQLQQAKQWKEKARVLAELLPLTEQQFAAERQVLQQQLERFQQEQARQVDFVEKERDLSREQLMQQHEQELQQVEAKVRGEMEIRVASLQEQHQQAQEQVVDSVRQEAALKQQQLEQEIKELQLQGQQQVQASDAMRKEHLAERERLESELQSLLEERRTLRADAADFTEQATRSKQQCTVLQKHLAEVGKKRPSLEEDWESALDRALAERDLYRQEADVLRKQLDERLSSEQETPGAVAVLAQKYKESVEQHSQVVQRLKRMEEQRATERGTWKCQLEAALAATRDAQAVHEQERAAWTERTAVELQGLQRRWQLSVVDRKRQFEELIALCSDSENGIITEAQVVQHLQQRVHALEEEMEQRCQVLVTNHFTEIKDYKEQIAVLNETVQNMEMEMEERCSRLVEQHYDELSKLQEKLKEIEQESSETIVALQQSPMNDDDDDAETQIVSNKACVDDANRVETLSERKNSSHNMEELSKSLAKYKRLHQLASQKYERAVLDRDRCMEELVKLRREKEDDRWEKHQSVLLSAMEEVRSDVAAVQTSLVTAQESLKSTELAKWADLRRDLAGIHSSLNDAVAELTLDADAMMQSREALQTVASDAEKEGSSQRRILEQQEELLQAMTDLREQMKAKEDSAKREETLYLDSDNYSLSRELIAELQQKEAALAVAQTELRHIKALWESEIASRQIADAEIGTLNDQADAYEQEIAILQSTNAKLVQKLRHLGLEVAQTPSIRRDDSSSLVILDEALALAEGLTHIVRCDETGAMEMLESMTEMMDEHEMRATSQEVSSPKSNRQRKVFAEDTQGIEVIHELDDDSWVDGSLAEGRSAAALPLLMEQLYSRCQLLERERVELMEVTLNVLESARTANAAQLDAAVATARRKATEEVLREQSQKERIFHKWCQSYIAKEKHT